MAVERSAAIATLVYMVRAVQVGADLGRARLAGPSAQPWCELLERVTRVMSRDLRPVVVPLVAEALKLAGEFTPEQRRLVGIASERLLTFALDEVPDDRGMIHYGIEGVCRTFGPGFVESAAVLRKMVTPGNLSKWGYAHLPALAHEVHHLLPTAPALVEEIYSAALSYRETDDSKTVMLGGAIMPMSSNRRQDYNTGLYTLGQLFPKFIATFPVEATGAVITGVEQREFERGRPDNAPRRVETITCCGTQARFEPDASHIWDQNTYRHELPLKMLDEFENSLVRLSGDGGDPNLLTAVLARVSRQNRRAGVWRRVLAAAVRAPTTLGVRVWELAASGPVLNSSDTHELVGELIRVLHPILNTEQRTAVERAILATDEPDPDLRSSGLRRRNRLLGCLSVSHITTPEATAQRAALEASGGPPPNTPLFAMGSSSRLDFSDEYWSEEHGGDSPTPSGGLIQSLISPVRAFKDRHSDGTVEPAAALQELDSLRALHDRLTDSGDHGVGDEAIREGAWTCLAEVSALLAAAQWIETEPSISGLVRTVLLAAACHRAPVLDPEREHEHDRSGGVYPSPRWHASKGLLRLAGHRSLLNPSVLETIERLAADQCAEIRAEVGRYLTAIVETAPDVYWRLLRTCVLTDPSWRVVMMALVGVQRLASKHPDNLLPLAHAAFRRFEGEEAKELRNLCLSIVITAKRLGPDPFGDTLVCEVVDDLTRRPEEVSHLIRVYADWLTVGPTDESDVSANRIRRSTFSLFERVARNLLRDKCELENTVRDVPFSEWPALTRARVEALRSIAHEFAIRSYFASGAFDAQSKQVDAGARTLSDAETHRFFREAQTLIGLVAELGFPDVAHKLVEILGHCVPADPHAVFLLFAKAVRCGQSGGFEFESLAVDVVVKVVSRYLADYRHLFRERSECLAALMEVLNIFVRAGWPAAFKLTLRSEEIYR